MSVFADLAPSFGDLAAELADRPVPEAPLHLPRTAAMLLDPGVAVPDEHGPVECDRLLRSWRAGEDDAQAMALELAALFSEMDMERTARPPQVSQTLVITAGAQQLLVRQAGLRERGHDGIVHIGTPVTRWAGDDEPGEAPVRPLRDRARAVISVGRRAVRRLRYRRSAGL